MLFYTQHFETNQKWHIPLEVSQIYSVFISIISKLSVILEQIWLLTLVLPRKFCWPTQASQIWRTHFEINILFEPSFRLQAKQKAVRKFQNCPSPPMFRAFYSSLFSEQRCTILPEIIHEALHGCIILSSLPLQLAIATEGREKICPKSHKRRSVPCRDFASPFRILHSSLQWQEVYLHALCEPIPKLLCHTHTMHVQHSQMKDLFLRWVHSSLV